MSGKKMLALLARGTGETIGNNMVTKVGELLNKDLYDVLEVPYRAEIAPIGSLSMSQSIANFKARADAIIRNQVVAPSGGHTGWIGVGFSLGAAALGDYVGVLPLSQCRGIGLLSDPRRCRSVYMQGNWKAPTGFGIAGQRAVGRGYPVFSYTAPGDPISDARPNAGIRYLAQAMGLPAETQAPASLFTAWADPGLATDLFNYGPGARHTCYSIEKFKDGLTYVQHLAKMLNALEG